MSKPHIDACSFGSITIDGEVFRHDVVIRCDGRVIKRKKKLSKEIYGTSHTLSDVEARFLLEDAGERLILGSGEYGQVELSPEASELFALHGLEVVSAPTPRALALFNADPGPCSALFHVTC
ncbi:MAG: hypothetical protein HQL56_13170 [Magnetococcales bacterium]|nr:hypothetical protein [Magnetococcales bacterium]